MASLLEIIFDPAVTLPFAVCSSSEVVSGLSDLKSSNVSGNIYTLDVDSLYPSIDHGALKASFREALLHEFRGSGLSYWGHAVDFFCDLLDIVLALQFVSHMQLLMAVLPCIFKLRVSLLG